MGERANLMQCPICKHLKSKVTDSRKYLEGTVVKRWHECHSCRERFTSIQRIGTAWKSEGGGLHITYKLHKVPRGMLALKKYHAAKKKALDKVVPEAAES
jgi:transcriptional repressor NrdR